jgi:hypothetical protein
MHVRDVLDATVMLVQAFAPKATAVAPVKFVPVTVAKYPPAGKPFDNAVAVSTTNVTVGVEAVTVHVLLFVSVALIAPHVVAAVPIARSAVINGSGPRRRSAIRNPRDRPIPLCTRPPLCLPLARVPDPHPRTLSHRRRSAL